MAVVRFDNDSLSNAIRKAVNGAVFRACTNVQAHAVQSITAGGKTGRVYKRKPDIEHRASAPGEAPAADTGYLHQHIRIQLLPQAMAGRVVASAKYAAFLEFGTRNMAPRPFMRPALAAVKDSFLIDVTGAVAVASRGRGTTTQG